MIIHKASRKRLVVVALVSLGLFALLATDPASAIEICGGEDSVGSDTGQTIRDLFLIMQVLGPIFGTLFFVGMSVAGAAQMKDKYKDDRRRVLLLGFSVPVAIVFLEAVANNVLIPEQEVGCFFPGWEGGSGG